MIRSPLGEHDGMHVGGAEGNRPVNGGGERRCAGRRWERCPGEGCAPIDRGSSASCTPTEGSSRLLWRGGAPGTGPRSASPPGSWPGHGERVRRQGGAASRRDDRREEDRGCVVRER